MKKLMVFVLVAAMMFSLAACGGDKAGSDGKGKLDYANLTEDDLLKNIKDQKNVTLDEFVDLVSTFSYVTIKDDLELEENITAKAIKKLRDSGASLPEPKEYIEILMKSEAPQVRGYALSNIGSLFGVSDDAIAAAKELIKTEKEPYVIKCAVKALANEGGRDAEIGQFLLSEAKNENAAVRRQVAYALGNSWNKDLDGAVEAEIELMNDSDDEVRKVAYEYSGRLGDDRVVAPISEMLSNEADAALHSSGVRGLVWLWYDYPAHESTSEAAYRATMDYFRTSPGSADVPAWAAVTSFDIKSENNYDAWREKATYFNPDELYEVMLGLVTNENLGRMTRGYACKPVAAHCTRAQFDALGEVINGLTDKDAKFIQDEYANQAKELDK